MAAVIEVLVAVQVQAMAQKTVALTGGPRVAQVLAMVL